MKTKINNMPEKVVRKRPRLSPMNVLSLMTVNWKVILSELIMMKRWRAPQDQKLDKNQMEYGNRSPLTEKIGFWNRLYNI